MAVAPLHEFGETIVADAIGMGDPMNMGFSRPSLSRKLAPTVDKCATSRN
jgi:hypothetical protein